MFFYNSALEPLVRLLCCDEPLCVCVSACLEPHDHTFFLSTLSVALARSSSSNVAICYVLPVLCMTLFLILRSLQRPARTNAPGAWYWLRYVQNKRRRAPRLDESFVQRCRSETVLMGGGKGGHVRGLPPLVSQIKFLVSAFGQMR